MTLAPSILLKKADIPGKAFFVWNEARVQVRSRTFGPQCSFLIQEMLLDYLITILAQKLMKIESDEIVSKIEFFT
eukprot:UN15077